ncbi:MAG: hypothetical protein AAFO61_11695 [Pseudomonadota bacterium]
MSFFDAFFSLGYSGIVLILTAFFVGALAFNTLGLHKRGWAWKGVFFVALGGIFVWVTLYLADTRATMMEALKEQGGPPAPKSKLIKPDPKPEG